MNSGQSGRVLEVSREELETRRAELRAHLGIIRSRSEDDIVSELAMIAFLLNEDEEQDA